MNFFENQDRARRKSALLILYFSAAVILIVMAVNLVAWVLLQFNTTHPVGFVAWMKSQAFWQIGFVTVVIIGAGSLVQFLQLRSGGEAVANMVGASPVAMQSQDLALRRYINVVEEMSIAAGVVMPKLYVMESEAGINAFVAGYQANQAVMVVTRGALQHLNRDELQGVVGHEFSHILNGDMRINVRLIAVLAGILLLGQIGSFLLRSSGRMGRSRDSQKAVPVVLLGGLALMAIGYVGLFFGRLIKSAISRQREYLADASSVQFTRNPEGIASALYRILQLQQGSLLSATRHAEDMNHMCFGESVSLQSLFASHPPLEERIRAIDPMLLTKLRLRKNQEKIQQRQQGSETTTAADSPAAAISGFAAAAPLSAQQVIAQVGQLQPQHYEYASQMHGQWPEQLQRYVHTPDTAAAVVAALLVLDMGMLDQDKAMGLLAQVPAERLQAEALKWCVEALPKQSKGSRLPLLELCAGTLRGLPQNQREALLKLVEDLIRLDQRYTLYEFVIITLLRRLLDPKAARAQKVKFTSYRDIFDDIRRVLSVLARVGADNQDVMLASYSKAMRGFGNSPAEFPGRCSLLELSASLNRLAEASPMLKQPILEACADCVLHDGQVKVSEYELLRAVAIVMDCPMPPLPPELVD